MFTKHTKDWVRKSQIRKIPHFRKVRKFAQPISGPPTFENKQMLAFSTNIANFRENRPNIFFCAKMFIKFIYIVFAILKKFFCKNFEFFQAALRICFCLTHLFAKIGQSHAIKIFSQQGSLFFTCWQVLPLAKTCAVFDCNPRELEFHEKENFHFDEQERM